MRPCGNALAKRTHPARAGRVEGRQSEAADHNDPSRLAVDTSPAAVSPDALFKERSQQGRKRAIVALARKLLVALLKHVTQGVVIEGAVMKSAG